MEEDQLGCVEDLEVAAFVGRWQVLGEQFFIVGDLGLAFVELVG